MLKFDADPEPKPDSDQQMIISFSFAGFCYLKQVFSSILLLLLLKLDLLFNVKEGYNWLKIKMLVLNQTAPPIRRFG